MIYTSSGAATGLLARARAAFAARLRARAGPLAGQWTGFTSVRAVAIGKTEGINSDPQKNALVTWVACGGDLIFVDGQLSDLIPSMPPRPRRLRIARLAATSSAAFTP
jgi:hypothetical protein